VAGFLHEGLGQKLTAAALVATKIAREAQQSGDSSGTQLANLAALLTEAVGDCRRLAQQVRGYILESAGLEMGLKALLIRFESEHDVACSGGVESELVEALGADRSRLVYQVAADVLAAAVAVGTPSMISLEVKRHDDQAKLRLIDDGLSDFPEDRLLRIRYQATALDGVVETTHHDAVGRTLECVFPLA
jgi:signal transduction histidine kinase